MLAACLSTCILLVACGGGGGATTAADGAPAPAVAEAAASAAAAPDPAASDAQDDPTTTVATVLAVADASMAAEAMALSAQSKMAAEASAAARNEQEQAAATGVPLPVTVVPAATATTPDPAPETLVVRARGSSAGGVAPLMQVRVNAQVIGSVSVANTTFTDYSFALPTLPAGATVDVVFGNDATVGTEQRDLFVAWLRHGRQVVLPLPTNSIIDKGLGAAAFDGQNTVAGSGNLWWNGALRVTWPAAVRSSAALLERRRDAVRFLQQASFGPTLAEVQALDAKPYASWISEQMALPWQASYQTAVQALYDQGDAWRPRGASYSPVVIGQTFWKTAITAPDQLRRRVAFALHQTLMVSQMDSNLWHQARAVAVYHDLLNRHAFGNFRQLLEDVALTPAMGIYLNHMRNRKEDAASGRVPDENFARELMQLFTIGLVELNLDGSPKRDATGRAIETYGNADVMALAKVFTGWSWAFADSDLTELKFRWGVPDTSAAGDQRIDGLPMKAYPAMHSTAAKSLFAGKPWAVQIPAGGTAASDLKLALDGLFNHPNVGPFIGRQLIQRLVTSQPSAAYVARVAGVFNNNGSGVRGDLAAVVRAILLDDEARGAPPAGSGKLREPVLRVAQWARALGAQSLSGTWALAWDLENVGERALAPASVFGHFRPGYVPPNTAFAAIGSTAPEFQIVNESTVAHWINTVEAMAGGGLGWNGTGPDLKVDHTAVGAMLAGGQLDALVDHLDLLLLGGRMTAALRQSLFEAMAAVTDNSAGGHANRARAASFLVLASPAYLFQP